MATTAPSFTHKHTHSSPCPPRNSRLKKTWLSKYAFDCVQGVDDLRRKKARWGSQRVLMRVFRVSVCVCTCQPATGFVSSLQPGTELSWLVNSDWFPLCSQWLSSAPEESMTQTSRQRKTMNGCERKRNVLFKFLQCVFVLLWVHSWVQLSNVCLYISVTELLPLCPLLFCHSSFTLPFFLLSHFALLLPFFFPI